MKRYALLTIGIVFTILAFIGVIAPIMPAAPFLIVALWAFARSHEKLHQWLMNVPIFRPVIVHLDHFEKHRAIAKEVKILSQASVWASFVFVLLLPGPHNVLEITVFTMAIICSAVMYYYPTLKKSAEPKR